MENINELKEVKVDVKQKISVEIDYYLEFEEVTIQHKICFN